MCKDSHRRQIMAEMSGAQAMYEMMVREQVRYVFGNPGTTELPLMDLFAARSEIDYILALHEDSALGVAAGYAEASRRAAVVNLHTNPGLAHALGNLYNAQRAGTPLVVTAGQQDTHATLDEPLLCADMVGMARPFTKWAYEVHHAAEIPAAMARAFKVAETPPTGPVFLSLPVNVMEERADIDLPARTHLDGRLRGDPAKIEEAAALLVYTGHRMIPASARLIQIDLNDRELGKNFAAEVGIQGDPRSCVEALVDAISVMNHPPSREALARRETLEAAIHEARARFAEQ